MNTATAKLNTYRQSPRKVRLLADLVRGKKVNQALTTLKFANKRASAEIIKLIESAVANAKSQGLNTDALVVEKITVDGGQILYRRLPMSRGRAFRMRKRTSHVFVSLMEKDGVKGAEAKIESKPKKAKAPVKGDVEAKEVKHAARDVAAETKTSHIKAPAKRTKNK
ncbi:MAG TPA: 50S ribosomal protein L22 [Candidatus Nanoarchaeia archaeon]|nr:50S ribosomal protein L22 [Candidatus Nanoarchaeia archaeon]